MHNSQTKMMRPTLLLFKRKTEVEKSSLLLSMPFMNVTESLSEMEKEVSGGL